MARQVIIDTDPGIDDAIAILHALRSPAFDVVGITTVAGNIGLATTTRNAGRILALAGRGDVPVIAGLAGQGESAAAIHGADGLGGVPFPEPEADSGADGVGWMAERLALAPEGTIDILALAPMTNLAVLVSEHPQAARRVGRVIAMGGAIREPGNVGPKAEFNIAHDPGAARTVLSAGLPLTLIPLDVTRKVRATRDFSAMLKGARRAEARASGALIDAYFDATEGRESRPLHDPCVMLCAEAPDLFACETMGLGVDGDGALVPGEAPVSVAMAVDASAALDLLLRRLTD